MILSNLHVVMNDCVHESRVLKETKSISRLLPAEGQIVVVSCNRSGLAPVERLADRRVIERIAIRPPRFLKGKVATAVHFCLWMLAVLRRFVPRRPTVVNIHQAETLILGLLFKLFAGSKVVYDPHELEAEKNGSGAFKKGLIGLIERVLIPFVDEVFVVNASIAGEYVRRYRCERPHVVMNVPPFVNPPARSRRLANSLGVPYDKKICLYLGGLMRGRGIEFILDAFESAPDSSYVVVFVGYGLLQGVIEEAASRSERIYFHPAVGPGDVLELAASADIGLCLIESVCLSYYYCLPNKFFEYLFAGIPVVVSPLPELTKLTSEYAVGVVLKQYSPGALREALEGASKLGGDRLTGSLECLKTVYNWDRQEEVINAVYGKYFGGVNER